MTPPSASRSRLSQQRQNHGWQTATPIHRADQRGAPRRGVELYPRWRPPHEVPEATTGGRARRYASMNGALYLWRWIRASLIPLRTLSFARLPR